MLTALFGSALARAGTLLSAALNWLTASAVHILAALLAVACLFALWQHHQAAKWQKVAASTEAARKADTAAWNKSVADAHAATALAEKHSQEAAQDADTYHDQLAAADAGLRDYIAAHRVWIPAGAATATGAAETHDAGVPADPAADTLVAVSEPDLRACDADYAYSRAAFEWGQALIGKGLAVGPPGTLPPSPH